MGRRKTLQTLQLASGVAFLGESSDNLCTQERLNDIYNQALSQVRPTTLYAVSTEYQIDRIKGHFERYCGIREIDPRQTLEKCEPAEFVTFLRWLCQTYTIKKTNTVITYWRQLSQTHIVWFRRRMDPFVMKEIYAVSLDNAPGAEAGTQSQFIEGELSAMSGLDDSENETPLLEAEDFQDLIAADDYVFSIERQRVQLAIILLLAAFTGSRPAALLHIRYEDLDLYVEKDEKSGRYLPKLGKKATTVREFVDTLNGPHTGYLRALTISNRKTYTFSLDDNPIFCVVTLICGLAFDDHAYGPTDLVSPRQLFRLRPKPGLSRLSIPWKREMLTIPIFRRSLRGKDGVVMSLDKCLTYNVYHASVVRLGEALGYAEILKTYCLRRAQGNGLNGRRLLPRPFLFQFRKASTGAC
ncbi:hypothetical protein H2200_013635 [Cladophialophora chaetospira]|uniref:Uncharacterized protein n=1 Tax=Cladophialophora chaetospira TaxID=386627 RepID=A0AA38UDM4_9EURO|nr:hypothetical protein H2200_013635 [Cladophialophora chaetospira]